MPHIQVNHLRKDRGEMTLLTDINFTIEYKERVGLVGMNGCGKSTLLEILSGRIEADGGSAVVSDQSSVAMLRQSSFADDEKHMPPVDEDRVTESYEEDWLPESYEEDWLPESYEDISDAFSSYDTLSDETRKYMRMFHLPYDRIDSLSVLSGGERTKLALSLLLSQHPKLLLLDEPTNHLDYEGIQTLIRILNEYPATMLIVSHDRYFLDSIVSRVLEIEGGRIFMYQGNYSAYRMEKARLFEEKVHRYEDGKKEQGRISDAISKVKNWSEKAHRDSTDPDPSGLKAGVKEKKRAKAKKMDKKVKNDIRRLERLVTEGEQRPQAEKTVRFTLSADVSHGKRILEASGLTKSFGEKQVFAESDFTVARGERVALWGPNGCGKSTLVAIISGQLQPDSGQIRVSPGSIPFVLTQGFADLPIHVTALEYLVETVGNVTGADRALLFNMGLETRHLKQKIETLSYGEQMKLVLSIPILMQRDFLVLDEPTNHLDLHTREMLEDTLSQYPGTLLLASHDLYLLNKVCDKVLVFQDGRIRRLEYSFKEYMERQNSGGVGIGIGLQSNAGK